MFFGAVMVLAAAMQHGPTKKQAGELEALLGVSRRTLVRWRRWWTTVFATSRFWQSLRGRVVPGADELTMPRSLLACFADEPRIVALLHVLAPISTRPWLEASAT